MSSVLLFGGPGGIRTHDLCVANAALSQLSYKPEYRTVSLYIIRWALSSFFEKNVLAFLRFPKEHR